MAENTETRTRGATAAATAIVAVAVAVAVAWFSVAPGIFGSSSQTLTGALPAQAPAPAAVLAPSVAPQLTEGIRIIGAFQGNQPRDPFRPLVAPTTTTTTQPGATTTTGAGGTTSSTTSTTEPGFEPGTKRVTLISITEDTDGEGVAVVQVDGVSFTVKEGQAFATSFKVVALDVDGKKGTFLFGDIAFTIVEGEEILK